MTREPGNLREDERKQLRREIGNGVLDVQARLQAEGVPLIVVLTEIIAALLSLAAYIAAHNAALSKADFIRCARQASFEQWK